jgi:hypothetical protein
VWLEVHPPVDAEGQRAEIDLEGFYALANAALGDQPAAIHWDFVLATLQEASGIPQMIGLEVDPGDVPPQAPPAIITTPASAPESVPAPAGPESPAAPAEPTPGPAATPASAPAEQPAPPAN